jgi:hypothetical protein
MASIQMGEALAERKGKKRKGIRRQRENDWER